jgi:acetate kinase
LAPLHQPHSLAAIRAFKNILPGLPQVACFDTAFHHTQPDVAQRFALPRHFFEEGVRRYGFHGLSYEYIVSVLARLDSALANERIIVAHLGNGASLCAIHKGRSIATTMGFTPLDGLVMGSRCGSIDPGVLLYLMDHHNMDVQALEQLLYHESGLLGISGVSSDMRTLLSSDDPNAQEAIESFVYRIGREIGSLAAALGGIDALIFTGGIGEYSAIIRKKIGHQVAWLGLDFDESANEIGNSRVSSLKSKISVWVVPTDENLMIAQHTLQLVS